MSLRSHFQPTLDLPGVMGAFCLSTDGKLIENFLPSPYTDAIFEDLGTRCSTLMSAVDMSYTKTDEYLIRFEDHCLYLHKDENCIVGVLCSGNPILAGLRISINLLLKTSKDAILSAPAKELKAADASKFVSEAVETPPSIEETEEIVVPRKRQEPEPSETKTPKRKSLFGFGKKKDKSSKPSNNIWG
jgi:predicted regulator of Ras-like GTPase activity (Roadblock/LC7/MglB family)